MNRTTIEWVKNPDGTQGYTWNPITGCLNGCPYCYARRLANGRLKQRYLANRNVAKYEHFELMKGISGEPIPYEDPFYPRFWMNRIEEGDKFLRGAKKPLGIFPVDMGEWAGDWIPESWRYWLFEIIKRYPQHRFYLLTKQPQNLVKFSPFPDNCWVGVTATNTEMFMQACSHLEYPVQAKLKYISVEPFVDWDFNWNQSYLVNLMKRADIDWLIIGAQTRPYKPPKIEWVEEIVRAADKAGIPVFLKDNLKPLILKEEKLPIWAMKNWQRGKSFELRQEMPQSCRSRGYKV